MNSYKKSYKIPFHAGQTHTKAGSVFCMDRPSGMDAWELHLTLKGKGFMSQEKDAPEIIPGDFLLFPPGTPHVYASNTDLGWHYYWVYFHPKTDWHALKQYVVGIGLPPHPIPQCI